MPEVVLRIGSKWPRGRPAPVQFNGLGVTGWGSSCASGAVGLADWRKGKLIRIQCGDHADLAVEAPVVEPDAVLGDGDGNGELEVVDAEPGWSRLRISSALKSELKVSASVLS
jgi:hypothetical protein